MARKSATEANAAIAAHASPWITLRAGPLHLAFDPTSGFVRYVRLGEHEVLRGIYAAVRDHNWDTVAPVVSDLAVEQNDNSFRATFSVECRQPPIDFVWRGTLTGDDDGTIVYRFAGVARSTFRRNRIGFCVLHPIRQCAGRPCAVETTDGATIRGTFPQFISPHQPFKNMRSIAHEASPGVWATVGFAGDVFEMEDQRNWSDASYKTYCTPLEWPFPVEVPEGAEIAQTVTLRLNRDDVRQPWPLPGPEGAAAIRCQLGERARLPRLGLGMASHGRPASNGELARLRALRLDHLRVDLRPSEPGFVETLRQAAREADQVGASLQVALHLNEPLQEDVARTVRAVEAVRPPVSAWLVFHAHKQSTPQPLYDLAREYLGPVAAGAVFGAGTNANFAELNRGRLPPDTAELVCFAVNPQVHAFDNASIIETLEAQPQMVTSARQFAGRAAVAVTPVTLRPRFNPAATGPEKPTAPGELPSQVDPRQSSLFAAGWTLGSIVQLAAAEANSATFYETTGWRGVMETEAGSPLPEKFFSIAGAVFPVYHVFADLAEARADDNVIAAGDVRNVRILQTSEPLAVCGLVIEGRAARVVLVANLTDAAQTIELPNLDGATRGTARLRLLDESNVHQAMVSPEAFRAEPGRSLDGRLLRLPPHAYARIEMSEEVSP